MQTTSASYIALDQHGVLRLLVSATSPERFSFFNNALSGDYTVLLVDDWLPYFRADSKPPAKPKPAPKPKRPAKPTQMIMEL